MGEGRKGLCLSQQGRSQRNLRVKKRFVLGRAQGGAVDGSMLSMAKERLQALAQRRRITCLA